MEGEERKSPEDCPADIPLDEEEAILSKDAFAERDAPVLSLIAQIFNQLEFWPLLPEDEEKALLSLYHMAKRELPTLAEALGMTPDEVALGIRITALESMGLGYEGREGLKEKHFPKELRGKFHQVLEGEKARTTLILSNARLVISLAKRMASKWEGIPLEDLIQEGFQGLFRSIDDFDVKRGVKLSTYATWWIRDAVGRGVRKGHFFPPGGETSSPRVVSMDEPVGEEGHTLADTLSEERDGQREREAALEESQVREVLKELLRRLNPREAYVLIALNGFFGYPQEDEETIARKLGIAKARVRQIEAKALESLKEMLGEEGRTGGGKTGK